MQWPSLPQVFGRASTATPLSTSSEFGPQACTQRLQRVHRLLFTTGSHLT
jgi:hypothetical protein